MQGHIFVIVGPPGVGKGTLVNKLLEAFPDFIIPSSYTTREPRPKEGTRKKYHYVKTEQRFMELVEDGTILEFVREHNNLYGTDAHSVDEAIKENKTILFEIEPRGAQLVKNMFKDKAITIFIAPPSLDALRIRMVNDAKRGELDQNELNIRMNTAKEEMEFAKEADHVVVNEDGQLEETYKKLVYIIKNLQA